MTLILQKLKGAVITLVFTILTIFIKRNKKHIAIGSWCGELYIDNSKYLFEKMLESLDESYHFYWIGKSNLREQMPVDSRVQLLEKDRFSTMLKLLRCKYVFCSQFVNEDICTYNIFVGARIIFLYHGFPIKKFGDDKVSSHKSIVLQIIKKIYLMFGIRYTYFLVSSSIHERNFISAFKSIGCNKNSVLKIGTPRNDFLFNLNDFEKSALSKKYKQIFNINDSSRIILYLPTFRRKSNCTQSLFHRENAAERSAIQKLLEKYNYVLIEKGHFADNSKVWFENEYEMNTSNYIHVSKNINVQELMVVSDLLISDYSGAFIDYLLLDRPIIHYIYDYEYYKNIDSGLYFSKDEFACGELANNYRELLEVLERIMQGSDECKTLRERQRKYFLENETGRASEQLIDLLFND